MRQIDEKWGLRISLAPILVMIFLSLCSAHAACLDALLLFLEVVADV